MAGSSCSSANLLPSGNPPFTQTTKSFAYEVSILVADIRLPFAERSALELKQEMARQERMVKGKLTRGEEVGPDVYRLVEIVLPLEIARSHLLEVHNRVLIRHGAPPSIPTDPADSEAEDMVIDG